MSFRDCYCMLLPKESFTLDTFLQSKTRVVQDRAECKYLETFKVELDTCCKTPKKKET